jgi:SSS family solute:Na+ symporter
MTYEFMVAGLFIPTLGAFFWRWGSPTGAMMGMLGGGSVTLMIMISQRANVLQDVQPFKWLATTGISACLVGLIASLILYALGSLLVPDTRKTTIKGSDA